MALRNDPAISAVTRARLHKLALKMNYSPDPALSKIASQRWQRGISKAYALMAVIFHNKFRRHPDEWLDPACKHAKSLGYKLEAFELSDFKSPEHLHDVLFSRGVSGIIFEQVYVENFFEKFDLSRFTAVASHLGHYRPPLHLVTPDRGHATLWALEETCKAGYKRAAVAFLDEPGAVDYKDKLSAALYAKAQVFNADDLLIEKFRLDQVKEFGAWVRKMRPQAVLGFNNVVYDWLCECGIKVPEDVVFVSLDTSLKPSKRYGIVSSGVWPRDSLILQTAVELLDSQLRTHQTGVPEQQFTVLVEGAWVPGDTFPACKV